MGHHKELIVQTPRAAVWWAHDGGHFTLPLRRRCPTFSNLFITKGASPHTQEHTRRHPKAKRAQPLPLHAKWHALRKRHAGKANHRPHETAHQTRSPLAHAESFARKNNTAPTNEGIRRGSVESFGAQCAQKSGKAHAQSARPACSSGVHSQNGRAVRAAL